jgi:hypothetical protein
MYKEKLNKWRMGKNASRQDWLAFARLYECRTAGISETSIQIYNKIRRIQDLKKYLKSHDEQEDAFFAEAMASQVPTPEHVRYCNPDGSDLMILPSQQLDAFSQGEPSSVRAQPDLSAAGGSQAANSTSASLRLQPWDASFDQDFDLADAQMMTTPEYTRNHPTSNDMESGFDQLDDLASSATFAEMSDLSSFKSIPDGSFSEVYQNAYGSKPQPFSSPNKSQSTSMTGPFAQPQSPGPPSIHDDARYSYVTACMLACMYGAARVKESMNQCLQRAATSFRQMCVLQSPFTLMTASTMLTWLLVHAEGSLSERVMVASFQVAAEALGSQDPACVLLEWMTAAAAGKLEACRIDSSRLRQIWQAFNQALGEEHGHTIIALYCLSFHLMFADKDFPQAERYLEDLRVVSERIFGLFEVQTINILATLSRAQHRQKKYLPALDTINRSLIAAPLGLNHPHRLELLLRKALIVWKLNRLDEMEELYWIVVKGRVATLGIHHNSTIAAHNSLVDVLHWNGTWESRKDDAHRLLVDPQVSVSDYESWWRRVVEANRVNNNQDRASSEEVE